MKKELQLDLFKENVNEQTTNELKISSREIAELTGKRHDNVLRDCDILNQNYEKMTLLKIEEGYYTHPNTGNQQHREYLLTKIQTLDLMTGYKADLRIKVNRRWEELEKQQAETKLPQNYIEALEALLVSEKEKLKLQEENKLMLPKAEFYDDVTGSDSLIDMKEVAKVLNFKNIGRNKLFELLRNKSVLMRDNTPYQKYVDCGYFKIIEVKWFNPKKASTQITLKTMVFQKGLDFISKLIKKEFNNTLQ